MRRNKRHQGFAAYRIGVEGVGKTVVLAIAVDGVVVPGEGDCGLRMIVSLVIAGVFFFFVEGIEAISTTVEVVVMSSVGVCSTMTMLEDRTIVH